MEVGDPLIKTKTLRNYWGLGGRGKAPLSSNPGKFSELLLYLVYFCLTMVCLKLWPWRAQTIT